MTSLSAPAQAAPGRHAARPGCTRSRSRSTCGVRPGAGPATNCQKAYCSDILCLSNAAYSCLTASDWAAIAAAAAAWVSAAAAVIAVIINKKGDSSDKEDHNDGSGSSFHHFPSPECFAAAPTTSDGHDRVYFTTNCFGNKHASWYITPGASKTKYHIWSLAAHDEGRSYEPSQINNRNGAYIYVKPPTTGDWQQWTYYCCT